MLKNHPLACPISPFELSQVFSGQNRVAQQVREATPYDEGPRFLIRDNDSKYGQCFTRVAEDRRIEVLTTPVRAPRANANYERFIGSVRRECLDHMLNLSERHLKRTIGEYVVYFNRARPHQSIGQRIPDPPEKGTGEDAGGFAEDSWIPGPWRTSP